MITDTGPSSSSFVKPGTSCDNYEVFLSFRGEDTRKTFTSHLHAALVDHGIRTFLDSEDLEKGEILEPQLNQAIQNSDIIIVVISKSHATSRWCLNELLQIVRCNKPVIPIFYHVSPADVRKQAGPFAEAFSKHEEQLGKDRVKQWRDAMTNVANHSGYDLEHVADGHEAKVVKMIVSDVMKRVDHGKVHVEKYLPGVDSRMQDVLEMLKPVEATKDVKMVGICGIGGLGKTTIAKTIYNKLIEEFEFKCFLENVRANVASQPTGVISLQKYLISEISREKLSDDMLNGSQATEKVRLNLRNKRVLLVIDDVDGDEQLDAIAGELDWFGTGSRILVTTRDKGLLERRKINHEMIYKPSPLDPDQSYLLFCHHAFGQNAPKKEYEELSTNIVSKLSGHPLALKVIGAHMFGNRSKEEWSQMSKKLEQGSLDQKVQKCLRISFDALDDVEKEIYLDICCFFIGKDVHEALYMWEAAGFQYPKLAIEELENKSFLEMNDPNKFQMHDVTHDMGRDIVTSESRQIGLRTRIWNKDDAFNMLSRSKGSSAVQGILVNHDRRKKVSLQTNSFTSLSNLRLLFCGGAEIDGNFKSFPSNLNWLDWSRCERQELPNEMNLEECAVLRLTRSDHLTQLWTKSMVFPKLRVLDLEGCENLETLPHDLSSCMPLLKRLILRGCIRLNGLPNSLCRLKELEVLDLYGCESVRRLPEDLGAVNSLKLLILTATGILDLPTSMRGLIQLVLFHWCPIEKHIGIISGKGEEELERLIDIIMNLNQLTNLHLPPVEHFIMKIFQNFQLLSQRLRVLEFHKALVEDSRPNYSNLVDDQEKGSGAHTSSTLACINNAPAAATLETLTIMMPEGWELGELHTLPSMPSLINLEIWGWKSCKQLWKVTEAKESAERILSDIIISPAPNLKRLFLAGLPNIETLPYLPSLQELSVVVCGSITSLWDITATNHAPQKLELLDVIECPRLSWNSNNEAEYSSLTQQLPKLRTLTAPHSLSTYLLDVQPLLPRLEKLCLIGDWRLRGEAGGDGWTTPIIQWLKKLPRLSYLEINYFTSITSIRGPWHELTYLETLRVSQAHSLEDYSLINNVEDNELAPPADPPNFKELVISLSNTKSIKKLPDLIYLKRLTIDRLKHLRVLPEIMPNLPLLEELVIHGCSELMSLPRSWVEGMLHLPNLTRISIVSCYKLRATLPHKLYEKGLEVSICPYVKIC